MAHLQPDSCYSKSIAQEPRTPRAVRGRSMMQQDPEARAHMGAAAALAAFEPTLCEVVDSIAVE